MSRPVGPGGLRGRLWLARLALLWEAVWPALWPPLGIAGLFLVLALFDALPLLPGWLHAAVLAAFAGAFGWACYRALPALRLPGREAARRRIERSSALPHRPLALLEDELAAGRGDPAVEAVWRAHRERALAQIAALRLEPPHPGLPRRDPWALRGGLLVLLVVGATLGWGDLGDRLQRAAMPSVAALAAAAPATLEVWITPPEYTGLAPRFLRFGAAAGTAEPAPERAKGVIEVPAGSSIMAQLHGGSGRPRLHGGGNDAEFEPLSTTEGARSFQFTGKIERAGRMAVTQRGIEVGAWSVAIISDQPPRISLPRPPSQTARASLKLEFKAEDDFGVTEAKATIRRAEPAAGGPAEEPIVLPLPLPAGAPKEAAGTGYHDLTAHLWAGLPVRMQLTARDAADQVGESETVEFVLPERAFNHPVAQLLVAARKQLVRDPGTRVDAARLMAELAMRPGDYQHDVVVFLALKVVHDRLLDDPDDKTMKDVLQLLWDTALRLEDGGTSMAERALRDAQQALREALERDASDAELQSLLDQLEQALDEFFRALAEDMRRNPEKYQGAIPPDADMDVVGRQDLQRMMDQIRDLATTGAKEAARQMLSQLREMLENLRAGIASPNQQAQSQVQSLMKGLEELARRQQQLLDQTYRDAQRQQESRRQGAQPDAGARAQEQEALRRALGAFMRQVDEMTGAIPDSLGRAEGAMRDAREALEQGRPGDATGPQGEALEQLRAGMGEAMRQLAQQFGGMMGFDMSNQGQPRSNRDPLGRPYDADGNAWGSDVHVPDQSEIQRARQILDELRRRAGERQRPQDELRYIDRLLERF